MAYKIKLPPHSRVHLVFHVSLLKKAIGTLPNSVSSLPSDVESTQVLELVLDRRFKTKNNRVICQLLIKWSGLPPALATWEDKDSILPLLKSATACGQAVIQREGNVTASSGTATKTAAAGRPKPTRKPNLRVVRPSWVAK